MNNLNPDWLENLSQERTEFDPAYAAAVKRAEFMNELLKLRKARNLTQEDVALRMRISRAQVALAETKPEKASLDRIAAYAEALGAKLVLQLPNS